MSICRNKMWIWALKTGLSGLFPGHSRSWEPGVGKTHLTGMPQEMLQGGRGQVPRLEEAVPLVRELGDSSLDHWRGKVVCQDVQRQFRKNGNLWDREPVTSNSSFSSMIHMRTNGLWVALRSVSSWIQESLPCGIIDNPYHWFADELEKWTNVNGLTLNICRLTIYKKDDDAVKYWLYFIISRWFRNKVSGGGMGLCTWPGSILDAFKISKQPLHRMQDLMVSTELVQMTWPGIEGHPWFRACPP